MKILINESDSDIRRLYQAIFLPLDVELTFTANADDTRHQADLSRYDLVMMDVEFPTMEGLEQARKMMEEKPERPMLVVSSVPLRESDLGDTVRRCRGAVMMKPFNINELRNLIKGLVLPKAKTLDYMHPALAN